MVFNGLQGYFKGMSVVVRDFIGFQGVFRVFKGFQWFSWVFKLFSRFFRFSKNCHRLNGILRVLGIFKGVLRVF